MKPPFAYYGGKTGLATTIAAMFPPHRVYIEPFFGSGAVFFAKRPAIHEIINDVDGAVVAFFTALRDRRVDLEAACALTPHARAEFVAADLDPDAPIDDLELARRFWARVNQSFAKTAGRSTGWSVTTARSASVPNSIAGRLGRFEACAARLMGVSIESCDAAGLIDRLATPDAVIYADPPYVGETRNSRTAAPSDYRCDMGGIEAHERLAEALHCTEATVFLSGYHSPLYDRLFGEWERVEWDVPVHGSNAVTTTRGRRVEVLWSNRPLLAAAPQLDFGAAS
jgi:DNA adenine methylase